jgi:iron(III) transport system permease protein
LLLRPAGFDTLSSRIYNYTSEGQWELAAQPSILLVFIGVIFVIMLTRIQDHYE